MPTWTSKAPDPRDFANIRLVRVPATAAITGIVTSHTYLGCYTHWDSYRTQPCGEESCKLCKEGQPRRWQCYFSIMGQASRRQIVVQLTPLAAQSLDEAIERYGSLRGLLINLTRANRRPNSRIIVETRALPMPDPNLPEGVDIKRYMELIWQSTDNQLPDASAQESAAIAAAQVGRMPRNDRFSKNQIV